MNTSESLRALRRANPRTRTDFAAVADAVRARLELDPVGRGRRRPLPIAVAGGLVAAVATSAAVLATTGSRGSEDAVAAVRKAAALTAASAQKSGTAVVRITHDGRLWGGTTISWNGSDLALGADAPQRNGRAGSKLLLVDGMLYGIDPVDGGWVELGPPESIDPDSGTTPTEILASVREDVGGTTARRFATGLRSLTTRTLGDGSTVYTGTIAAGLVARETGFKEGQAIRVLPFGYVAHDAAANPHSLLNASVLVGEEGVVHRITVRWATWEYSVSYSGLGATAAPVAPPNARELRRIP